jgi:hypothetical protein
LDVHRLLGVGIGHSTPSQVAKATVPWCCFRGPVLFLSDPRMYLYNPPFRFKIGALLIALFFNYTIHRKVALSDSSSAGVHVVVGVVSLALWISVVFGGLFIAFG